jgi:hypothetical protein
MVRRKRINAQVRPHRKVEPDENMFAETITNVGANPESGLFANRTS